jgi:hypothetical protein
MQFVPGFEENKVLTLSEELFLLALSEKKDSVRIPSSLALPFALAAAQVLELAREGCLDLDNERIVPKAPPEMIDDDRLRVVMEKICKSSKPRKVDYWVYELGSKTNRIHKRIVLALLEKGLLEEEGKYFRWGDATRDSTGRVISPKYPIKHQIRHAMFCNEEIDARLVILTSLIDSCGMVDHLFTRDEIVAARKRLRGILKSESADATVANWVGPMVNAVQYALAVSVSG